MALNLSGLSNVTTAATSLSNLILVTPNERVGYQPQAKDGEQAPPKILFHYEGEQTATLDSDITDHFVEDNTAIQDQIALKPVMVTTHGFIGELNDVAPEFLAPLKFAAEKLTTISNYFPSLSATAIIAYNAALQAYDVAQNTANAAVSAWSSITGSGANTVINGNGVDPGSNQNKQQLMFQQFYGYWRSRTLFTVQTPWAVFEDMAIKSLRAIQDADTRVITDFEVTFKQMQFAETKTTITTLDSRVSGRLQSQAAGVTNNGSQILRPSSATLSGSLANVA